MNEIISNSNIRGGISVLWRSDWAAPTQPLHAGCGTGTEVWWETAHASCVGGLLSLQPRRRFKDKQQICTVN